MSPYLLEGPHANLECWTDMPGNVAAATFETYYMFTHASFSRGDVSDVIYDTEG